MPRMKEIVDYLDTEHGGEEKHVYLIDLPQQDWTSELHIDLQPDHFVQLKKVDGQWHLATSLPDVLTAQKKGRSSKKQ